MARLTKPLADLVPADFDALCADQQPEDEQLELKEAVPTKTGRDAWQAGAEAVGEYGRNKLLAEVVAMANSYGGDVVIGIRETEDKPHRADSPAPVPACVELAHRLEQQASACIEPPMPMLQGRGIVAADDGSGFVVLRVPRSHLAPHRLIQTKECYQRIRDRTEAMTMRQIQDLTFAVARGLDQVEGRLREFRDAFDIFAATAVTHSDRKRFGYSVAAVPASAGLYLQRVHRVGEVTPIVQPRVAQVGGTNFEFHGIKDAYDWRPVLRGTCARHVGDQSGSAVALFNDGALSYNTYTDVSVADDAAPVGRGRTYVLYPGWLFCDVMNALQSIERVRVQAGAAAMEYALEVGIFNNYELPIMEFGTHWRETRGKLQRGFTRLPKYAVGPPDTFDSVVTAVWQDFWSCVGIDAHGDVISLAAAPKK